MAFPQASVRFRRRSEHTFVVLGEPTLYVRVHSARYRDRSQEMGKAL